MIGRVSVQVGGLWTGPGEHSPRRFEQGLTFVRYTKDCHGTLKLVHNCNFNIQAISTSSEQKTERVNKMNPLGNFEVTMEN